MLGNEVKKVLNFALASEVDEIPDVPGIYAWYLPLKGSDSGSLFEYLKSIERNFEDYAVVKQLETEGQQKTFEISQTAPRFSFDSKELTELNGSITSTELQTISRLVLLLSFLSEPFYIGKTDNGLRTRLKDHLSNVRTFDDKDWNKNLRTRVAKLTNSNMLRNCLIVYICLDQFLPGASIPRLLEHVLIRIIHPSQSVRG